MRYTLPTNKREAGFTLIEMLVIAPIVILALTGFIALMVALVGDVLQSRDRSTLAFENQDALDRIEQDVRLSTQFLTTSKTLPAPQGSNNNFTGTSAFSSSSALILGQLATDKNPADSTRKLIYYAKQPNDCGPDQTYNRLFLNKVVYFLKGSSLWRRVVVPTYNTNATVDDNTVCSAPWQRNTCSPGYTLSPPCQTNDTELMRDVANFSVKYYSDPTSSTDLGSTGALAANTIEVTLTGSKMTAGKIVTSNSSLRVTKLNSVDVDIPAPGVPSVSYALSGPASVVFSWPIVPNATSYLVQYNVNGGTTQMATLSGQTTSFTVDANRNDTVSISVRARNSAGQSNPGTASMTLPAWTDLNLQNEWTSYSPPTGQYNTPQFTRTSDGIVFLRGLVKNANASSSTVIGNLPPGYRPNGRLIFQTATSPTGTPGRVDVLANGDVVMYSGNRAWVALDMVHFIPAGVSYTRQKPPLYNGYEDWSDTAYEPYRVMFDATGRVHMQGLLKSGTTTTNTAIAQLAPLSNNYKPAKSLHFPSGGNGWSEHWIWLDGEVTKRGTQTSSYMGMNVMYYPGTVAGGSGWKTVPESGTTGLQGTWVYYNPSTGNYPIVQYIKSADGVVTMRGLIKDGSTAANTTLFTLPAGYRPIKDNVFVVPLSDNYARVDVAANGQVILRGGSGTWLALNFSYIADQ